MTVRELLSALSNVHGDREVVVAGHGQLAMVTHAYAEAGALVCVLYVAEPVPEELVLTSPEATT